MKPFPLLVISFVNCVLFVQSLRAVESLQTRPGFKVELVAAEPLVQDPVAFDWGVDGRLWVVEMRDYPLGPRVP